MRKVDVATLSHDELKNVVTLLLKENQQLKKQKKYGLVWEETKEKLDNGDIVPLVKEKKDLRIVKDVTKDTNYLIEGDNYHSLLALQKTHLGKVDVIYIDPPYNTGNEFVYNDKIVDKEDNFRHSKWLSFMHKRLKLAKKLLSEDGVIFVSIDDNEQAQLKLLMDEVFGEQNFVSNLIWVNNKTGRQLNNGFAGTKEYILTYSKSNKYKVNSKYIEVDVSSYDKDNNGYYTKGTPLYNTNSVFNLKTRPNLTYTIYVKTSSNGNITDIKWDRNLVKGELIVNQELISQGYISIQPPYREKVDMLGCWRWGTEKLLREGLQELLLQKNNKNIYMLHTKDRLVGMHKEQKPKDIVEFHGYNGSAVLEEIFENRKVFSHPKNIELIKWLFDRHSNKNATVLDFFAGSGTTGHAVMELNKEDGGNRKFILCTNNEVSEEKVRQHFINQGLLDKNTKTAFTKFRQENEELVNEFYKSEEYQKLGIARSVTYERLKRVIKGYTTPKGKFVEGLSDNNLTYLQTKELEVKNEITVENSDDVKLYNVLYGEDISLLDEVLPIVKLQYNDKNTIVIPIEDTYEIPDLTEEKYNNKSNFVFLVDDSDKELVHELTAILAEEFTAYNYTIEVTSTYIQP